MTGVDDSTKFMPTKLTVDSVGRLYVIARNINMGLIQLDAQGKFVGYIGAPEVKVDFWTLLWRRFTTKEQISKMEEFVPTELQQILPSMRRAIFTAPSVRWMRKMCVRPSTPRYQRLHHPHPQA